MHDTAFLLTGETSPARMKAAQDWPKWSVVDHNSFSQNRERSVKYYQGPSIDIGIDFHQLCN